jgi:hypothetical protein
MKTCPFLENGEQLINNYKFLKFGLNNITEKVSISIPYLIQLKNKLKKFKELNIQNYNELNILNNIK